MSELTLFLREAFAHPIQMGALFPSSKQLAKQLVNSIPTAFEGLLLELGAGTGAITETLLKQPYAQQVVAIESSEKLAKHLQVRLPQLTVYQGDAQEASQLLNKQTRPISIIVSGLPMRALAPSVVQRINQEIENLLSPGGLLIQYTYSLWGNLRVISSQLRCIANHRVWCNLPPARIVTFEKV